MKWEAATSVAKYVMTLLVAEERTATTKPVCATAKKGYLRDNENEHRQYENSPADLFSTAAGSRRVAMAKRANADVSRSPLTTGTHHDVRKDRPAVKRLAGRKWT